MDLSIYSPRIIPCAHCVGNSLAPSVDITVDMQANDIDNDSEHLSDTQGGDARGLGKAAVCELNQIRSEALRHIDESRFSCVSLSPPPSTPVHRHGALKLLSSQIMLCRRHGVFHRCVSLYHFHPMPPVPSLSWNV